MRMLLALLVGVLLGWGISGFRIGGSGSPEPGGVLPVELDPPGSRPLAPSALDAPDPAESLRDSEPEVPEATKEVAEREEPLFGRQLLEHFARGFDAGWLEKRPAPVDGAARAVGETRFRDQVLALPRNLGRQAGEDANERDALNESLRAGDGLGLLLAMDEGTFDPNSHDDVEGLLDSIVENRSKGATIDGAALASGADLELGSGSVIRFGPGVHTLEERRLRGADGSSLPDSITVLGAGRDQTLLRIGDISIRGDVEGLAFQDLTLDAQNDGLFDMRTGALVLDLERVRVVRFDAGHGGCTIFSSRGGVVRARDCQFAGGYGRSPGSGDLARGGPFLARFENCQFEIMDMRTPSDRHVTYRSCTFDRVQAAPDSSQHGTGDFLYQCTFGEAFDYQQDNARDLADLFWQLKDQ